MRKNFILKLFSIGIIILIIIFAINQVVAQRIILLGSKNNLPDFEIKTDIFVDKNSSNSKITGAPNAPFNSFSQALEFTRENSQIKNIYIKPAQYQETLDVPENINLYAFYPETLISNQDTGTKTLTLNGNNLIQGLTIQGGRYGIYIPEKAQSVRIENCKVENANWYGIFNEKHPEKNELYKLEIFNSEISRNSLQGLYLQKGNFLIKNSQITHNGEEGIDLHLDMDSIILNSQISNNGEGGIETELGNINLSIENCSIGYNGSSGINLQSHSENSSIKILNNQLLNNQDFGIRCALHSKIKKPYFSQTFQEPLLRNNFFLLNGKALDENCWIY